MKHEELTAKIICCAMKVHRYFGAGFPEIIYKRSLMIELQKAGIYCLSEIEKKIYYEMHHVGTRRLDLLVEDVVLCELKALSVLDGGCYNRILNYLRVFEIEVGLLFNFGQDKLIFKRFINARTQ